MLNKKKKSGRLFLSITLALGSSAYHLSTFASDSSGHDSPVYVEIQGQPVDPSSIPPELRDQIQSPADYEGDSIPSPRERDEFLRQAGLEDYVKDMDHLSRDLLIYRAGHLPINEFKNRYPKLSSIGLSRLHDLVQKKGARK